MNQPSADKKREYISITEIQREYLPISQKKIREFCKAYLECKTIGSRIIVNRKALEELLTSAERSSYPL